MAQEPVAPTPDRPSEIAQPGGYSLTNSFETGWRFADVTGSRDAYRAAVNFGNGVRLFEGELRLNSLDGQASFLDELAFRTRGAPADPYQSHTLRAEKNGVYRYDMQMRVSQFYNRLPALWSGERGLETERTWQTHSLTLSPGGRVEFELGYDRNKRSGPGFFTTGVPMQLGAFERGNFLRFAQDLRQVNNEYRAGASFRVLGLAVTAFQSLDNYKEDTLYRDGSAAPGVLPNLQEVDRAARHEPFHGNTPVTNVAVRTEKERWIGFHGRFSYASGARNSVLSEDIAAVDPTRALATLRQTFVLGRASRKQGTGDFTLTLLPTRKWAITNTSSANNTRIDGGAEFLEVSLVANQFLRFETLGIRHLTNATEANYRPVDKLSLYGVYRFSTRRIQTRDATEFAGFGFERPLIGVNNDVHSGAAGVRWLPAKGVRISLDAEVGRADQPLAPSSERRFHNEQARIQWRRGAFAVSGFFRNRINENPAALVEYSAKTRTGGFQGSWVSSDTRWTLDGGYSVTSLDTSAGIFNLLAPAAGGPERARTFYASRLHAGNFGLRAVLHSRATLYLGYSIVKDAASLAASGAGSPVSPAYPYFSESGGNLFAAFPLTYQSPLGRLSLTLTERLSWNAGWQYYGYSERLAGEQNYNAHVGYTSFRWTF